MRLIDSLATTPALAAVFSDESVLQAMLDFEAVLARAEARAGVIPEAAADAISTAARASGFDAAKLAEEGQRAGTLSIPLVQALTRWVRAIDDRSAGFVHWGTTSQDVSDTAMVMLLGRAHGILAADHQRLQYALRRLSRDHSESVMLGRTLLQPAPPVTFGLKVAGWHAALRRSWKRLAPAFEEAAVLQFGGASGTLAVLGEKAMPVGEMLAAELRLRLPEAPWHANRDRLAAVVCGCGVYAGSLAKMARDLSLMMQHEVSEASEPGRTGRGGSSSMPHKHNPVGCVLALAAATRIPASVAAFLYGMVQEHERAAGGWQSEWATLVRVVEDTGLALASMRETAEGLVIDAGRMRANIESTRGVVFAERAVMLLAAKLGREAARQMVEQAVERSVATGGLFRDALGDVLTAEEIAGLDVPEQYLGAAETFRKRLLEE